MGGGEAGGCGACDSRAWYLDAVCWNCVCVGASQVLDDSPTAEDRVAAARAEIQELQASITENNVSKMDMIRRLKVGRCFFVCWCV